MALRRPAHALPVGAVVCLAELLGYYATEMAFGMAVALAIAMFWAC